ncbi:alpha/beta-hydrolase [Lindgomyces ingoldianus]|uniref:Alpha/beta-hydrolase n=1 Tax=Lindgomyces ingoldianus TaxID=673940 RepID=A0ACB6QSI0_9PLEO|nr:alpha/beta-hydrolase [Lindgomyces ingoldianus]KAF2469480.1 alpha/beta-hydrolase [Lindgomyces ingoldianus]
MAPTPGILYVTMQPKSSLPIPQFHDWYNNEHGPGRLRLSFCQNGFRYRANDILAHSPASETRPEWMAIYDIEDMDWLTKDVYTKLRLPPVQSQRERDTMKQIKVDRRFYDFVEEVRGEGFKRMEDMENCAEGNVMVAVFLSLHPGDDKEKELARWYKEEHIPLLMKVPGWRRTRRFVTSNLEPEREKEFLALHEYAPVNGLGGPEFVAATSTKWNDEIYRSVVGEKRRRTYDLYYTFGPAPRDLSSLSTPETVAAESPDGLTKTIPASAVLTGYPAIESFVTTPDRVNIPYRLEGSSDPNAPVIVLVNSILVNIGIWDSFVPHLLKTTNYKYRILRYNTRGRTSVPTENKRPITVDVLASDIITLLNALRVPTATAVGVSLGGATALNAALKYPTRITAFVACDTNSVAPPGNPKAWGERIEVCETEGAKASSGEPIVGNQLAELTVRRWFTKESYASSAILPEIERVKNMVKENSLQGFKESVQALYQYDFRELMRGYQGKGAFVVGAGDGVLPKTMKEMAETLGTGVELKVVDGAGHLPMVERPEVVAEFVEVVTNQFVEIGIVAKGGEQGSESTLAFLEGMQVDVQPLFSNLDIGNPRSIRGKADRVFGAPLPFSECCSRCLEDIDSRDGAWKTFCALKLSVRRKLVHLDDGDTLTNHKKIREKIHKKSRRNMGEWGHFEAVMALGSDATDSALSSAFFTNRSKECAA